MGCIIPENPWKTKQRGKNAIETKGKLIQANINMLYMEAVFVCLFFSTMRTYIHF